CTSALLFRATTRASTKMHTLSLHDALPICLEQSIDYRGQVMGILLSQYLAGDQSSKLFTQIREQLGAAYNVEASCFANNSLFLVSAGLDPSKIAAARKIILSEMGKLVQGEVEDDLFKKAKKAILRNMKIGRRSKLADGSNVA